VPYLSEDFVEEVRARNDIVEVISGYVKLKRKGASYFGLCPFHGEKTPSFSVAPSKQMYYCFGCGAGGNVFTFLMEYENFTFIEAVSQLAERVGMEVPKAEQSAQAKQEADKKSALLMINKEAAKYFYVQLKSKQGERAYAYLKGRALSDETITHFGLGYSNPYSDDLYQYLKQRGYSDELLKESGLVTVQEQRGAHDKFWNRVMFPIMDVNNKVIGFGGRVMGDAQPKYMNSPETLIFDKSRNLFGLNVARTSRQKYLLLCEGYMDVISLHQAGFTNAVASLGTAFTAGHARLLKRYTDEVILTYDSDGAGTNAAVRAIPILKEAGITAKVLNMKPYKDPDEFIKAMGADAYQKRIKEAKNSFFFELDVIGSGYDLRDPEEKTKFHTQIARKLLEFPDELERENYMQAVAQEYQIGYEALRKLVNRLALGGNVPQRSVPRREQTQKKQKADGMSQSQNLLLTALVERPQLFEEIRCYISPQDFEGGLYREVAAKLYEQYERGTVNPAQIISTYREEEPQRAAAAMFNTDLLYKMDEKEQQKALKETIVRMKRESLRRKSQEMSPTDMNALQQLIEEQRQLEQLERLALTF
jgi:DNA primase